MTSESKRPRERVVVHFETAAEARWLASVLRGSERVVVRLAQDEIMENQRWLKLIVEPA